jgi:hypothetical protein
MALVSSQRFQKSQLGIPVSFGRDHSPETAMQPAVEMSLVANFDFSPGWGGKSPRSSVVRPLNDHAEFG